MRATQQVISLCLISLCLTLVFGVSATVAQTPEKPAPETQAEVKKSVVPELQDIVPLAANLGKRLEKLKEQFAKLPSTDQVEEKLVPIQEAVEKVKERLALLEKDDPPDFGQLRILQSAIQFEENRIKRITIQVTSGINVIEDAIDEWRKEEKKWAHWREALSQNDLYSYVQPTFTTVEGMFRDVRGTVATYLKPFLAIQQETWQVQNRILELHQRINRMILAIRGEVLESATPFMFSMGFLAQFDRGIWDDLKKRTLTIEMPLQLRYLEQKGWLLLLQVAIVATLVIVVRRWPDLLRVSSRLKWFVNRPLATGLLVTLPIFSDAFVSTVILRLILLSIVAVAAGRMLGGMVQETWLRRSIYGLLWTTLLLEIFDGLSLPAPLLRLFVAVVTLCGVVYLARRAFPKEKEKRPHVWFLRLCIGVLLFCFGAEILGFSLLAVYILRSSLLTLVQLVLVWLVLRFSQGMIEVLVRSSYLQKFALIKNNTRDILAKTDMICLLAMGLLLVVVSLRTWKVYASMGAALSDIMTFGYTIGERHFSIGLLLAAGVVLYGAFVFSWSVQSLMLDGVILSRKMQRGVRISMARLVHYAVVLIGGLVTLSVLGFDFTNIAIIGGALGVGIGFGMQNIVNNFVCGLIMLFERPVKVGDAVQFADLFGRVKQVGLRATVVETFDNAEIVVPNADLITSQVTNWTLAERRARLRLPMGVAYGSDVALVMQTLMECAEDHVLVMSNPKPAVLFLGFGASSLDFELRVWIADFDSRRKVQSEINQDIDLRFRELGVEIPFPQQDLHLRSVDSSLSGLVTAPDANRTD